MTAIVARMNKAALAGFHKGCANAALAVHASPPEHAILQYEVCKLAMGLLTKAIFHKFAAVYTANSNRRMRR
jgi:hypothetical protein